MPWTAAQARHHIQAMVDSAQDHDRSQIAAGRVTSAVERIVAQLS